MWCGVVWDNASRVTNLKGLLTTTQANNQNFGDDAVGNRISGINNGTTTYHLATNCHRLASSAVSIVKT